MAGQDRKAHPDYLELFGSRTHKVHSRLVLWVVYQRTKVGSLKLSPFSTGLIDIFAKKMMGMKYHHFRFSSAKPDVVYMKEELRTEQQWKKFDR